MHGVRIANDSERSLELIRGQMVPRIRERAKRLKCPQTGRSIYDSWYEEKLVLTRLPSTLPEVFDTQVSRTVSRDCLVIFEGRQYSVPFMDVGRQVQVRGSGDSVLILVDHQLVKSYPRGMQTLLLIDQADYQGESTEHVISPTPLGIFGKEIVLERSREAPKRPIDQYASLFGRLA